jgi:hypothetical protein
MGFIQPDDSSSILIRSTDLSRVVAHAHSVGVQIVELIQSGLRVRAHITRPGEPRRFYDTSMVIPWEDFKPSSEIRLVRLCIRISRFMLDAREAFQAGEPK